MNNELFIVIALAISIIYLIFCGPLKERSEVPVPQLDPDSYKIYNVVGVPTMATIKWYCDFDPKNTSYKPKNISFISDTFINGLQILTERRRYTYKDCFIKQVGNIAYYEYSETSELGFTEGQYEFRILSLLESQTDYKTSTDFGSAYLSVVEQE